MGQSPLFLKFTNFANLECKESSPLYEYLSLKISEDDDMLELCSKTQIGQPVPNLLFGTVHYLLLKGRDHPLKEFYPSLTKIPRKINDETFLYFKDFCNRHREEMLPLLKSKRVQTNEVRRCAYLYPIFSLIYKKVKKPLSLIEIGTSAGLQLLWDKYSYSYGTNEIFGNEKSTVHITSEIKGRNFPSFLPESPPVASKIGIDLHISDLRNDDDYLWLKSLIWPEHEERLELFENAASYFKENPVELIQGDGIALLSEVVEQLPKDTIFCIFHTHVANQLPDELKVELIDKIRKIGKERDVFHLYNNIWDRKLHLDSIVDGIEYNQTIGDTDGHGKWFEWSIDHV